jgi:subtilisin family serine protease
MTIERPGYAVFILRTGEALTNVPAHADCLTGAGRAASQLDRGPLDRALRHRGDGFRAEAVFHARRSLNVAGEQHRGYDDVEEELGLSRTYRVRLADPASTPWVLDRLRALPAVESAAVQTLAAAPFETAVAMAPEAPVDAPQAMVRAAEALALEPGDERVTVACVDSGIALGHAELQRKLLAGFDAVDIGIGAVSSELRLVGDSRGPDFAPLDDVGHGTHVAGVIGAQGWRMPKGLAGLSLILPLRVLAAARPANASRPVGVGALPDIDCGMKVAVDLGAHVINMSFGTRAGQVAEGAPPPHKAVVAYATRYGCVLVAASGNSGQRERFYPAALPEVIAVGSVDLERRPSRFSTSGDHVAIMAPGERIYSSDRRGYRAASGTSFAAPFVAATAALLMARRRRQGRPRPTPGEVRRALVGSARNGVLDAAAALHHIDAQEASS